MLSNAQKWHEVLSLSWFESSQVLLAWFRGSQWLQMAGLGAGDGLKTVAGWSASFLSSEVYNLNTIWFMAFILHSCTFFLLLLFCANYQLSCMFTLKEFRVYGRLSDLPTQYQMSDHPLRVLIGVIFCWVGNNVTFDSVVIMEYFIDDHCHLQKGKKKEQLKVSQVFSGRSKPLW